MNEDFNWTIFCLGCGKCCGCVPFEPDILVTILNKTQRPYSLTPFVKNTVLPVTDDTKCVFLTPENRCAVYENRPKVCQLYGTIPELACPFKNPEFPMSTMAQNINLIQKIGMEKFL